MLKIDAYTPPKAFISYSHDSAEHKAWVLILARRLMGDGVDVILDRWDLKYGTDIARFMEDGVTGAVWFVAICTPNYIAKANAGTGGSGYEKTILAPSLMRSTDEKHVVPVWRGNPDKTLPTFVGSRLAADFNADADYEDAYAGLIRTIHGQEIIPKPAIGPNPFAPRPIEPRVAYNAGRYVDPNLAGTVTFDYSNNNGIYVVGGGDYRFHTRWSTGSGTSIYALESGGTRVALADGIKHVDEIDNARLFDFSSKSRMPSTGEFIVLENDTGYFAVVRIVNIQAKNYNSRKYEITFDYWIQPNRSADMRGLA